MMYFDSLQTAWNMAGHGPYVWSSYALTCVVLGYLIIAPLRRTRDIERELFFTGEGGPGEKEVRPRFDRNVQGGTKVIHHEPSQGRMYRGWPPCERHDSPEIMR